MVVASLVEAGLASPSKGMDAKPRVIAAEVKNNASVTPKEYRDRKPHIAGELGLLGETTSEPHWVEVKDGQLIVYPICGPQNAPMWRLPLRHLNLQPAASGRPRGFSLSKHGDTVPIATFQVDNELDYERWVKTLAAELMRQTPLEAVRFLDILGITATISRRTSPSRELECHGGLSPEPECRTWLRCSSISEESVPDCCMRNSLPASMSKGWSVVQQPVPLIVTKEPIPRDRLSKVSVDTVDARTTFPRVKNNTSELTQRSPKPSFMTSLNENVYSKHQVIKNTSLSLSDKENNTVKSLLTGKENCEINRGPYRSKPPLPDVVKDLPPCDRRSRTRSRISDALRTRGKSVDIWHSSETESGDEAVAGLIARCQQVEKYVPVREKRLLFESLCRRASTRFNSSDNINEMYEPNSLSVRPRTQSLHDLSKYNNNVAVKEICRYFEQRGEQAPRSPSPECKLRIQQAAESDRRQLQRAEKKLSRLKQNISEAQGNIWRLQDQSNKLNQSQRSESSRIQMAVEKRMAEEKNRLKKIQEEAFKIQREIDVAGDQFSIAASKTRHYSDVR